MAALARTPVLPEAARVGLWMCSPPHVSRRPALAGPRRMLQSALRSHASWKRPSRRAFGAPQDEAESVASFRPRNFGSFLFASPLFPFLEQYAVITFSEKRGTAWNR